MHSSVYRPHYLPITLSSLSFIAGIALQLLQSALWPVWIYMLLCMTGAFFVLRWLYRPRSKYILLIGTAILAFSSTGWRASYYAGKILSADLQRQDIVVEGQIVGLPQWQPGHVRFTLAVNKATWSARTVSFPEKIALVWHFSPEQRRRLDSQQKERLHRKEPVTAINATAPPILLPTLEPSTSNCSLCIAPGEYWRMTVRLKQPHGTRNPFGFDYELWLWEQGLGATGYVHTKKSKNPPQKIGNAHPLDVRIWRDTARLKARQAIYQQLLQHEPTQLVFLKDSDDTVTYPTRAAGIVAALLMGDQRSIEQADWQIFRSTGVSHLFSISGLHITLFAWLCTFLTNTIWRQATKMGATSLNQWLAAPTAALWGGITLASLYAWFSGWNIPAQRTCLMLLIVALLRTRGLLWPWWSTLAAIATVVLLIDPWALLQPSFWLSFVAVGVLFVIGQTSRSSGHWISRVKQALISFMRVQLAILFMLAPLTLLLFGQFSLIGLLANAIAAPFITFIVTPLTLMGTLWHPIWQWASWLLQLLMFLLQQLALLPWASYQGAIAPLWAGTAAILGGLLLMLHLPWSWRFMGALGLLPVLLWHSPKPSYGHFDLVAVDVGQGSAVLVHTRTHTLLFDAGPQYGSNSNAGERVLLPLLHAFGDQPDLLILSHQDTDHTGGAMDLLRAFPSMQILGSIDNDHPLRQKYQIQSCTAGSSWQWDGVTFSILHPPKRSLDDKQPTGDNASSCVLHISNRQRSALLTGDITAAQEQTIIARQQGASGPIRADVLLAGHHGSKTSTSTAWLNAVQPQWVLIQQGYLNRYRHPHPTVLQRLQERQIHIKMSQNCGAAWWRSASNSVLCERAQRRHYWQHQSAAQEK